MPTAKIKQVQGLTFAAKADSNHWITMDGPEEFGGSNAGIRPKELLLLSLGGCTAADVASILQKKRVQVDGFELNVSADMTDGHPKEYENFKIEYVFYGDNIKEKDVERAIELSQDKYCGVSSMFRKFTNVTHSYKIVKSTKE